MGILKEILSISGEGSLFKFVSQSRNGIIVESLETKKRMHASSNMKISSLEDIAVFTYDKEVPLADIFKKIQEKEEGKPALDFKSPDADILAYFGSLLPDYDKDRVYVSDIRKIIRWYNQLTTLKMLDFSKEAEEEKEIEIDAVKTGIPDVYKSSAHNVTKPTVSKPQLFNARKTATRVPAKIGTQKSGSSS